MPSSSLLRIVPLFALIAACTAAPNLQGNAATAAPLCKPEPLTMGYATQVLHMVHVYTGEDGVSHAKIIEQTPQTSTYLGAVLRQFQFGDPSNVVIVGGPPNFNIPKHPAPYREIFLLLAGSSIIELSDGTEQELRAGSLVLFEDVTGPGHGGRFGPCGYVAVDLQYKPATK